MGIQSTQTAIDTLLGKEAFTLNDVGYLLAANMVTGAVAGGRGGYDKDKKASKIVAGATAGGLAGLPIGVAGGGLGALAGGLTGRALAIPIMLVLLKAGKKDPRIWERVSRLLDTATGVGGVLGAIGGSIGSSAYGGRKIGQALKQ